MSLDLNKLANKLDEALSNETSETLTKFLNDKRMENNKQQTALEIFWNQLPEILPFTVDTATAVKLDVAYQQAKEMYQDEMEAEIIKQSAEKSTSEANKYAEGYKEGYKRAVDYMKETLKNKIEVMENANNEFKKGTANTTGTTFLCTEFVSDQLFYKGTLPHCMRCGKPQYQHPIITNTK
jgi:hypothetical protein